MQDAFSLRQAREREASHAGWLDEYAARAASGDREAFEAIYNATIDDIFAYLIGQVRNEQVAEDLAANIFLKAWHSAKSYRRGSNKYRRWLFAIAHNELRDHWRRDHSELRLTDDLDVRLEEDSEQAGLEQMAGLAVGAMETLNEQQRQIVALRFFSELSHAEIAKILGKREGAVRAQLLRALRQMRKVMNNAAP